MKNEKEPTDFYLFAPKMQKFFKSKRKSEALMWIPVETSLLFSDEFQNIAPISRCIFVSFMLLCGIRGDLEIPYRINYLANTLGIDKRAISKGIDELISANLLHKRERKREEKESKAQTDRQETPDGGVCVDYSDVGFGNADFGLEHKNQTQIKSTAENPKSKIQNPKSDVGFGNADLELENKKSVNQTLIKSDEKQNSTLSQTKSAIRNPQSQFTIEECLKYVEICKSKGDEIKNAKALANHLFKTGESDAFILHTLYPQKQEEIDRATFGEPRQFTDEPCPVCFGAKMADTDGKGFRPCTNCVNERGKATGWNPLEEITN